VRIRFLPLLLLALGCGIAFAEPVQKKLSQAFVLGEVALAKGQPEKALSIYGAALKKRPRSKKMVVGLIRANVALSRCENALALLLPYRRTRVVNGQVLEGLSACFSRLGDSVEATYWAEERVLLAPPTVAAYASLSGYRRSAGDWSGAIQALEKAEDLDPLAEAVLSTKLQVAVSQGDVFLAEFLFQQLEEQIGSRSLLNWFMRAKLALDLGDFKETLAASAKCLEINRQFAPARAIRAEVFRRLGQVDVAEASLAGVDVNSIGVGGLQAIQVRLLADQGLYSDAHALVTVLQSSLPVRPDVVASRWYLAQVEGDRQEADRLRAMYELVQYNPHRHLKNLLVPLQ
jgi:tetratricopeptide (TPR) repeat protein